MNAINFPAKSTEEWVKASLGNDFVHVKELGRNPNVLIFLHGLGGNGSHHMGLWDYLPSNTVLITPNAPIEMSPYSFAWYFQIKDDVVHTDLLLNSAASLKALIDKLPVFLGQDIGSVLVAGYSQGGTMSVTYPLLYPESIDFSGCFCGYIAKDDAISITPEIVSKTNFFWWHGKKDFENNFYLAERGTKELRNNGANLNFIVDPHLGHTVPIYAIEELIRWWTDLSLPENDALLNQEK